MFLFCCIFITTDRHVDVLQRCRFRFVVSMKYDAG